MPIFDQGYQHWEGRLSGHAWRWLAVTRQGVRQQFRRRRTKWLVATAFVPSLVLGALLVVWGLLEQKSTLLEPFMFLIRDLPEEIRSGPKAYRNAVWTLAFYNFFTIEQFFAMILVLTVGPDLVSQDMRFNALPLYFSRPLRRIDYFFGKLGVIATFLVAVSVAPAVAAYLIGVAFSLDVGVVRDTWRVLFGSIAYGLVVVLSAGPLMLAISSLSRNSRLVGATWVGLWILSNVTSGVLFATTRQEWCPLVSYTTNLERIGEECFDAGAARQKFIDLFRAGRDASAGIARSAMPFGGGRKRFGAPPPPPAPPRASRRRSRGRFGDPDDPDRDIPPPLRTPAYLRYPWTWSAGVLGGLLGLSALTLATRVKSMDRLK